MLKGLFLSLVGLCLCKNDLIFLDEGNDIKKCNGTIMAEYLEDVTKIPETAQKSSHEMRKICPQLDWTCCNEQHLESLKNEFLAESKKMDNLILLHSELMNKMKSVDISSLKKFLLSEAVAEKKDCIGSDFEERLNFLIYILENGEDVVELLKAIVSKTRKFYSAFACEFCHPRMHLAVDVQDNKAIRIRHNFLNLKLKFQASIHFLEYADFLYQYSVISRIGLCMKIDKVPEFETLKNFHLNLSDLKMKFLSCQSNAEFKDDCFFVFGFSNLYDRTWDFVIFIENKHALIQGIEELYKILPKLETPQKSQTKLELPDWDGKLAFYQKNPKSNLDFDNADIVLSSSNGLEMFHNSMNESIWELDMIYFFSLFILFILYT
jgi:hypothetical protein